MASEDRHLGTRVSVDVDLTMADYTVTSGPPVWTWRLQKWSLNFSKDCGLCRAERAEDLACPPAHPSSVAVAAPQPPHVGRPRLQRGQGRLRRSRGARVRPRPGERWHLLL